MMLILLILLSLKLKYYYICTYDGVLCESTKNDLFMMIF